MKEFLKSPKKTAILGLISCIVMLIFMFRFRGVSILYNCYDLYFIGLIIYFSIVLIRMYKQKGNIKIANYILVATFIISIIVGIILAIMEAELIFSLNDLSVIIMTVYLINILFIRKNFINNKIFGVVVIGVSIYEIIKCCIFISNVGGIESLISGSFNTAYFIKHFVHIAIIPYFYNYYELLKEE